MQKEKIPRAVNLYRNWWDTCGCSNLDT